MTVVLVRNAPYRGPTPAGGLPVTLVLPGRRLIRIVSIVLPACAPPGDRAVTDEHLRAEPDETDPAWLSVADVIARHGPGPAPGTGCLIVATIEGGLERVLVRNCGRVVETAAAGPAGTFASVVHTWLVTGRPVDGLAGASITVGHGPARPVTVRPAAAGAPAAR